MKVKRYKRVQRILGFYQANFGLVAPFKAVLDGTFVMAAKENQINLREQIPKYLCDKTELRTTPCVLAELKLLGTPVGGALHIASTFSVHPCGHNAFKSPQACLLNLAKRGTEERLFLGTQDPVLSEKLRSVPGTPILYIKSHTLLLEKPASMSEAQAESAVEAKLSVAEAEAARLKELKRRVLGESEQQLPVASIRRKRRAKQPNPLSCLKKKKKSQGGTELSKKRKRRKKKTASS